MSERNDPPGPWPEPDEPREASPDPAAPPVSRVEDDGPRAEAEDTGSDDRWAAWDDRTEAKGSKGVAIAVAGVNLGVLIALPALLVVGIYTFVTVYAVVKALGSGSDEANATVVLLGVVGLVTLFVTLLGIGGWLVGRSADPKKRKR
ncbi:MAG: hypothetical protein ACRDGK_02475 [Actinomycetota bacterium]